MVLKVLKTNCMSDIELTFFSITACYVMLVVEHTLQGQLDGKYFHCMFSVKEGFPNKSFCHQHELYC